MRSDMFHGDAVRGNKDTSVTERGEISFSLKAELSELRTLASQLEAFAEDVDLPMKTLFELNLVLDELFTNLVNYGCKELEKHYFEIFIKYMGGELSLRIEDDGKRFNPLEVPKPDIQCDCDDRKIGGLGVHFLRNMMDSVEYSWENGKNCLRLRKKIPAENNI